ncbi:MAG: hypothetical protein DGJ47_001170, partial [Rickettsiaceae bacterium]
CVKYMNMTDHNSAELLGESDDDLQHSISKETPLIELPTSDDNERKSEENNNFESDILQLRKELSKLSEEDLKELLEYTSSQIQEVTHLLPSDIDQHNLETELEKLTPQALEKIQKILILYELSKQEKERRLVLIEYNKCLELLPSQNELFQAQEGESHNDQYIKSNILQLKKNLSEISQTYMQHLLQLTVDNINEVSQEVENNKSDTESLDQVTTQRMEVLHQNFILYELLRQEHNKRLTVETFNKCLSLLPSQNELHQAQESESENKKNIKFNILQLKQSLSYMPKTNLQNLLQLTANQINKISKEMENNQGNEILSKQITPQQLETLQKTSIFYEILKQEYSKRIIQNKHEQNLKSSLHNQNNYESLAKLPKFISKPLSKVANFIKSNFTFQQDTSNFKLYKPKVNSFIGQESKIVYKVSVQEFQQAVREKAEEQFNILKTSAKRGANYLLMKSPEFRNFCKTYAEQAKTEYSNLAKIQESFIKNALNFIQSTGLSFKFSEIEIIEAIKQKNHFDCDKQMLRFEKGIEDEITRPIDAAVEDMIYQEEYNFMGNPKQLYKIPSWENEIKLFSPNKFISNTTLELALRNIESYRAEVTQSFFQRFLETVLKEIQRKNKDYQANPDTLLIPENCTSKYIANELENEVQGFLEDLKEGNLNNTNTQNDVVNENKLSIVNINKNNSYENTLYNINISKPSNFYEKE